MKKGLQGWTEIFKGGKQVDSAGREHDGDLIIDRAVANFSPGEHEPPLVIGHPRENGPAWGWVREIKAETVGGVKRLFAKADQVAPEFEEMVRSGRFKKRSASFYANGALRHIGFLGAMPPAVKGLADVAFAEDDQAIVFEFGEDGVVARMFRRLRDWLIEEKGAEQADKIISDWDVEYLQTEAMRPREMETAAPVFGEGKTNKEGVMPGEKSFSEADLNTAKEQAAAAARADERKKVAAEFAEQQRQDRATARKAEIKSFCEKGAAAGAIAPAWIDGGLLAFMEALPAEEPVDFGEAGGKKSPYAWFVEFMQALPKLVDFSETAGRSTDFSAGNGSAGEKLNALVEQKMAGNAALSFTEALAAVQREHRDLAAEYQAEIG